MPRRDGEWWLEGLPAEGHQEGHDRPAGDEAAVRLARTDVLEQLVTAVVLIAAAGAVLALRDELPRLGADPWAALAALVAGAMRLVRGRRRLLPPAPAAPLPEALHARLPRSARWTSYTAEALVAVPLGVGVGELLVLLDRDAITGALLGITAAHAAVDALRLVLIVRWERRSGERLVWVSAAEDGDEDVEAYAAPRLRPAEVAGLPG